MRKKIRKIWRFRQGPSGSVPLDWAESLNITPLLLNILWRRGFNKAEAIEEYLSGRLNRLARPETLPHVSNAAELLAKELLSGKKFAVWGDYDVDGITATTIVLDVLEEHGFNAMHHLPDRISEGYGLNIQAIEALAEKGCQLLLTVDCGISNQEAVARAAELGMTVIVSDHHLPPTNLPVAGAIVNPRLEDSAKWPCAHLAGVGVAFYIMCALNNLLAPHTGRRYLMDKTLDLVALGTLADIMPLDSQNRLLVRGGLTHLANAKRPGMAALKTASGLDVSAPLNSDQVVFRLAPRINAAGRMGHADLALNLLRCKDHNLAQVLADQLNQCNAERKAEESRIYGEASEQAKNLLAQRPYAGLVLAGEDWHPGIVGIVASKIVEDYNLPSVVLTADKGTYKGSGRSVPDFDLFEGLKYASPFLAGYGGHRQAAGVRLLPENLENFRKAFSEAVKFQLGEVPPEPVLLLDGELGFEHACDHDFLNELDLMQPFGPGNPEPLFASPILIIKGRYNLGRSNEHVRLELEDPACGITLTAKAWRMGKQFQEDDVGKKIRLAYTPRIDMYNGVPSIDIGIKDWKMAD